MAMTLRARHLGACPADMKPGDTRMTGMPGLPAGMPPMPAGGGRMTAFLAILIDTYRELSSRRLFWLSMGLSALVVLAFAVIGINEKGMSILTWTIELPLLNTLILLTSGTTVTWAHHALLHGDREGVKKGLIATVLLGALFTAVQVYEYMHAPFAFKNSIYGATFFMATGFHGFHVLVGTIFLLVCLIRVYKGHFTPKQHLGFEFAAWYWHFVDVVWLFLFAAIYVWGNWKGVIAVH